MEICLNLDFVHMLLGLGIMCASVVCGILSRKWLMELKGIGLYMVFVLGCLFFGLAGVAVFVSGLT